MSRENLIVRSINYEKMVNFWKVHKRILEGPKVANAESRYSL